MTAFYEGDLNLVSSNRYFLSNALAFLCQRVAVLFNDLRRVADKYYVQCNNLFLFLSLPGVVVDIYAKFDVIVSNLLL